jgi:hypothetical protein
LRGVCSPLRIVAKSPVQQKFRMANSICKRRPTLVLDYDQEPMVIRGPIHIEDRIGWILPVVQREELRVA